MLRTVGYTDSDQYKCLENLRKGAVGLYVTYCGWEKCPPGHRFGPNKRISHILHIVDNGKGVLEIFGQSYEISGGQIFLIPSGVEAWYQADLEEPWTYRWIGFEGISAREVIQAVGFRKSNPVLRIHCMEKVNAYLDFIIRTPQLVFENELKRNGYLMLMFYELMVDYRETCLREGKLPPGQRYPGTDYVEKAIDYISANYSKRIKINELADYIGVNRSYLTSCFQKSLGCSPQEYLVNLRIEKAKSLLKKEDIHINEVASIVGYTDPLAFSKAFKSKTGLSPKEYRGEKRRLFVCKEKYDYEDPEL